MKDRLIRSLRKEYKDTIALRKHKFNLNLEVEFESENSEGLEATVYFNESYFDDVSERKSLSDAIGQARTEAKSKHEAIIKNFDDKLELIAQDHNVDVGDLWHWVTMEDW